MFLAAGVFAGAPTPADAASQSAPSGALAPRAADHPQADAGFASSFEQGEPEAVQNQRYADEQVNFAGGSFAVKSILDLVTEVTSPGDSPGNEAAPNAADALPATKWLVRSATGEIVYRLSEASALTGYTITSANDAPERDPRDFIVEGSANGQEWQELDARTGQTWREDGNDRRLTPKSFELKSRTQEYTYFRLTVTANNGADGLMQLADWELLDAERADAAAVMTTRVDSGPTSSQVAKTGVGFTGTRALQYAGRVQAEGDALATNQLFDVDVPVAKDAQLSYKVFPVLDEEQTYAATHVAVDLVFTDGTRLSRTEALDSYGFSAAPRAQGEADVLYPDQWNSVTVDLGAFEGKTIEAVLLGYDQPAAPAGTVVRGWVDDVRIGAAAPRDTTDGLVSWVDTRRGTNSTDGYSRGNTIPATAWPNGFNFFTPMTNADTDRIIYHYQRENTAENLPALQGIGISHQPSLWIADRNQLALLPADGSDPSSSLGERELTFRHENEVARPDIYEVTFENGLSTAVTPTDHGGVYRFGFTGDSGSVLVDQVVGPSKLTVDAGGVVTGWIDGGGYNDRGRTRMFVYGAFDRTPSAAGAATRGDRTGTARYAAFDTSTDKDVELRLTTSLISLDQAKHSFALELEGLGFDDVKARATAVWNERLGVVTELGGATDTQQVSLYSSLYRLNLYPNSHFENTGTAEQPVHKYASPVQPTSGDATDTETNAKVVAGKLYVNHGFWDTYRTAWPAFAFLYPDLAEEITEGFVQQFRDGGWVSRWSSPGYADSMTGTSSDVSFAEMLSAGVLGTELALDAYDSALKNATAQPPAGNVGRKGLDRSIFLGFTPEDVHESASWALEGYINDSGIARMAAALAENPEVPQARRAQLAEEADYFADRATHYVEMFSPDAGMFAPRHADGSWVSGFDKMAWGGAFTEASAWTFAFHAPHDVDGLAALYGGRQGLLDELDAFLTTPERADRAEMHEAREARDIRIGMLGISNQVAHHIPYVAAEAGAPAVTQRVVRDIMQRVFVGSDIGQGYVGDEDNGEFSAWYVFSALGFYPLQVGSGDYTIGSPLFDAATVRPLGGEELRITAPGAASGAVYVDGVSIDGEPTSDVTIDGDRLRDGGDLDLSMSATPSGWGAKDLEEELEVPQPRSDVTTTGLGVLQAADGTATGRLTDNAAGSGHDVVFPGDSAQLTWTSASGPVRVEQYTLTATGTDGAAAPSGWMLEGSMDGQTWTRLDERTKQSFSFGAQTRPFSVSDAGAYSQLRLTVSTDEGRLGLAELEIFAAPAAADELQVTGAEDQRVRVGDELTGRLATIVGAERAEDLDVRVAFDDGSDPVAGIAESNGLGGWSVTAPHTFARAGVYSATVSVTAADGASGSARTRITAFRDDSLTGAFNNTCIGDLGAQAANCDGEDFGYDRAKLAANGFVQGETHELGDTGLSFDLPDVPPGSPDNVTGEGQTIALDLGAGATRLALIGTATQGNKDLVATVTFADSSTQTVPLQLGDWVDAAGNTAFGNTRTGLSEGRLKGTVAEPGERHTAIYATTPVTLDTDGSGVPKQAVSLTLPAEPGTLAKGGRTHLFAVASDGDRSASAPLELTASEVPVQQTGEKFTAQLATASGGRVLERGSATVSWGDESQVRDGELTDGRVSGTHTYAQAGTYQVWVTVDDGVRSAAQSVQIVVEDAATYAPQIAVDPALAAPGETVRVTGTGFAPDEDVAVTLGEPAASAASVAHTSVAADGEGAVDARLTVPEDAIEGTYSVTALGDVSQTEARAEVRVEAAAQPEVTTVTLAASIRTPVAGKPFALVATLAPHDADGEVVFLEGEAVVGTATVTGGTATADVTALSSGTHTYVARFTPADPAAYQESASDPLVLQVRTVDGGGGDGNGDGDADSGAGNGGDGTGPGATGGTDGAGTTSPGGWLPRTGAGFLGLIGAMVALLAAGGAGLALRRRATSVGADGGEF